MQMFMHFFRSRHVMFRYGPEIILGLLIVATTLLNVIWIRQDNLLGPDVDSKPYFILTDDFIDNWPSRGWSELPTALNELSLEGRPPLYQLFSIPFLLVFGRSMDAALLVNLPFQILLLISIYQIGKLVANRASGILSAVLVSAYPPLIQLAHIFRPHYALAGCVALGLWRLLVLLQKRSISNVWLLILSMLFGVFVHPFVVFALTVPVVVLSIYIIFFQTEPHKPSSKNLLRWFSGKLKDPVFLYGFIPAFICAALLALSWYLTGGVQLLDTLQAIDSQALQGFRGYTVFTKGLKSNSVSYFWWYLRTMPNAISNILALFFAVGLIYSLTKRKLYYLTLAIAFFGAYLLFAMQSTMTWMHFAEVLPVVSVLSVSWIGDIKRKYVRYLVTALLLTASLFVYWIVMWGYGGVWGKQVAATLSSPISSSGACLTGDLVFCATPPSNQNWKTPFERLIGTVLSDPDCSTGGCNLMIAPYGPQFQSVVFAYYLTIDHPTHPLTVSAIQGNAWGLTPFDFRTLLESPYIAYIDQNVRGASYNVALAKFLHAPPASFSHSHQLMWVLRLPSGQEARLIKRVSPVTLQETEDVIHAVHLPQKYKFQQFELLAPFYVKAGQYDKAVAAYKQVLVHTTEPDAELYFNLASAYAALGQDDNAALQFRKVMDIDPNSKFARQARRWLHNHQK
jgi:hypothetical protein